MSDKEQHEEEISSKRRMPDALKKFLLKVQGGKMYLPAAYRLVWFRDECPDWGVETMLIEGGQEAGFATVQAKIYDSEGKVNASGIKTETRQDFPAGWVEKAETGAIARALAVAGFGTQFSEELNQGDETRRPADSPQGRPSGNGDGRPPVTRPASESENSRGGTAVAISPNEVWTGPGLCPRCHAPENKKHGKPCVT